METTTTKVVGPRDGKAGFLGSIGVRFMLGGEDADERFSLVEHPMSARALAAPLHRHTREDEDSYVVEGRGAAPPGDGVGAPPGRRGGCAPARPAIYPPPPPTVPPLPAPRGARRGGSWRSSRPP